MSRIGSLHELEVLVRDTRLCKPNWVARSQISFVLESVGSSRSDSTIKEMQGNLLSKF